MKTISPALQAHYALETTTIARCWRFQRRDGTVVAATSCDIDILFGGVLYLAKFGVTPTALAQDASSAVDNSQATGFLSSAVTEADMQAGLWDGATVTCFEVNYMDLTMGQLPLTTGTIGNIQAGRVAFTQEVRGLTQTLQNPIGDLFSSTCPATLGDARCKVNLAPFTYTGTVTAVTDLAHFADSGRKEAVDWFKYGLITFTSGANVGLSMEVGAFSLGAISLQLPMPYTVAVGDAYTIVAGCNKTLKGSMARTGAITLPNFGGFIQYDSTRTEPAGFYNGGSLLWTSGANNGVAFNILASAPGQLTLGTAPTNPSVIGDGYIITPPASVLRNGDCTPAKFNNVINFRGFPDVPGADLVLGLGGTKGTTS